VRRILSFALGLGIGLVIGGNIVRRLDAVQQRFAPDRIGVAASAFVERTRARVTETLTTNLQDRRDGGTSWTR
jgi:hypothetical protein